MPTQSGKTLFSPHYLEMRLPQLPDWAERCSDAFARIDESQFIQQMRSRRPRTEARLSPAAVAKLRRALRKYVPPLRAAAAEATRLEARLAEQVNIAYAPTPNEVALLWRTAPPRMPIAAKQAR
jgi:hypothetical protein